MGGCERHATCRMFPPPKKNDGIASCVLCVCWRAVSYSKTVRDYTGFAVFRARAAIAIVITRFFHSYGGMVSNGCFARVHRVSGFLDIMNMGSRVTAFCAVNPW